MHLNQVRQIAKGMGINSFGMKKADVIRAVQQGEKAVPCYATDRVDECGEDQCLWRSDCLAARARRVGE